MKYSERSKIIVLKLEIFFDFGIENNAFRIMFAQTLFFKQVNVNPL